LAGAFGVVNDRAAVPQVVHAADPAASGACFHGIACWVSSWASRCRLPSSAARVPAGVARQWAAGVVLSGPPFHESLVSAAVARGPWPVARGPLSLYGERPLPHGSGSDEDFENLAHELPVVTNFLTKSQRSLSLPSRTLSTTAASPPGITPLTALSSEAGTCDGGLPGGLT
jgi:hypothetical protein